MEDALASTIHAQGANLLRGQELERLEGEIVALDILAAQEELVTKMRALMVDLGPDAESVSANRQRHADDVVGVDEIVGGRAQVELREDAADQIQLHAVAGLAAVPSDQPEAVADAHRSDRRSRA